MHIVGVYLSYLVIADYMFKNKLIIIKIEKDEEHIKKLVEKIKEANNLVDDYLKKDKLRNNEIKIEEL